MSSNHHDLIKFGRKNYTYINGFLGDEIVRQIISELYPSKKLELVAEQGTGEFEDSMHHVLYKDDEKICSVEQGCQNIGRQSGQDCNDTLCQSYSLLNYFIERKKERNDKGNKQKKEKIQNDIVLLYDEIPRIETFHRFWKYEKQMMMINMYHQLLNNNFFLDKLTRELHAPNKEKEWEKLNIIDSEEEEPIGIRLKESSYPKLFESINKLLQEWYEYGFFYYMNKGIKENPIYVPEYHNTPEHRKLIFPYNEQSILGKRGYSPSSSHSSGKSKRRGGKRNKTIKKSCQKKRKSRKNVK